MEWPALSSREAQGSGDFLQERNACAFVAGTHMLRAMEGARCLLESAPVPPDGSAAPRLRSTACDLTNELRRVLDLYER